MQTSEERWRHGRSYFVVVVLIDPTPNPRRRRDYGRIDVHIVRELPGEVAARRLRRGRCRRRCRRRRGRNVDVDVDEGRRRRSSRTRIAIDDARLPIGEVRYIATAIDASSSALVDHALVDDDCVDVVDVGWMGGGHDIQLFESPFVS